VLLLASGVALARFDASVDATTISEADTLRLTLRTDGANVSGDPDLDALTDSFDVLSTQRSSEFRSINGRVDGSTTWTLLLKPKHTGKIAIPSIAFGDQKSAPIEVMVRELDPQLKRAIAQTVFFETTYEPKQVYVQAEMVVTRRLFYLNGAQLYGDMPNVPDVPGAMVKALGESEHTTAVRDGRTYGMIEQRFSVFPERSGDLAIPHATVTGSVRLATDAYGGGRRIGVDVSSDPLTIRVLPIPDEYPRDAPWLPATDVELLEDWPYDPRTGLATGTPTQRTLIVRVDGNAASAIPPLAVQLPTSIKAYPEQPKLSESQTRSGIVGTRTESSSLVATQPGDLTLDEVRLPWWDVAHRELKTATLPARTIHVTGVPIAPPSVAEKAPQKAASAPEARPTANESALPHPSALERWLGAALAAALLGWLVTLWRERRRRRSGVAPALRARDRETQAFKVFARACTSGEPHGIRRALDEWLKARYGESIDSATREFTHDPAARAALDGLNASLYQRAESTRFATSALERCVAAARKRATRAHTSDELPALYPSA
jgi:hypothetical protein